MEVNTRAFGLIDINDDKIIKFDNGIVGFSDLQLFALIHNEEKKGGIRWLQSLDEPCFALPVMDPLMVVPEYNPEVEDELIKHVGDLNPDDTLVLVTVTVPSDLTKMTVNLKAPIIINAQTKKACQVVVEGDEYAVKFPIYQILMDAKAKKMMKGDE